MAQKATRPKFGRRNETELLRLATDVLPSDFPNPDRLSCPEAGTLQAIADRHLSLPDVEDVVDHIATCSPCFSAYSAYRKEHQSRSNRRRYGAVLVFLTVAAASWYFGRGVLSPKQRPPEQIAEVAPLTTVLDFHNTTSERSDQTSPPKPQEAPHLQRALLNLRIELPLGTEDGSYAVQFRNNTGGIAVQSTGTVKWDGTTETLSTRIDLRTVVPGQYTVAVRRGDASWHQYSVVVD